MKLRNVLLFSLLVLGLSCQERNADDYLDPKKPDNLLPEDKFWSALFQIHYLEAQITHGQLAGDTAKWMFDYIRDSILTAHNTDTTVFFSSMAYYNRQPETMFKMYQKIADSLAVLQSKYELKHSDERKIPEELFNKDTSKAK